MRELIEPEKTVVLKGWRDYATQDGGEKFNESIEIINKMVSTSREWAVQVVERNAAELPAG